MKTEGKPVDPQSSCREFRHGAWSLEEEPSVCENCEFFDEDRCYRDGKAEKASAPAP